MTLIEALLTLLACLIYGKLAGIRKEMKRLADFCERSEKRMEARSGEH